MTGATAEPPSPRGRRTPPGGRLGAFFLLAGPVSLVGLGVVVEKADLFPKLRFAIQRSPQAMPSSTAVPRREIARGLPVVSIYVSRENLSDPATGILANKLRHGRPWERPGMVSYFDKGRLLFASGVGVRVHGGGSRITSPRQGFRLHFRREYGAEHFPPSLPFGTGAADPVRRLVVHNDARLAGKATWHFVNPLAYDIAGAIGCITPETKPARFFLNGQYQGVFVLKEHFDRHYFTAHFHHDAVIADAKEFDRLGEQIRRLHPLTMETVGRIVNLENLTRWFLSILFCATGDAFQGPGQFRDQSRSSAQWFWVNWDMDLSFRDWRHDTFQALVERIGEGRRGRRASEPRAFILTRLLAEDEEYRDYFKHRFVEAMNYKWTPAFLDERHRYYAGVASSFGVEEQEYLQPLKEFLRRRPAYLRELAEQWLNTEASWRLFVNQPLTVDGVAVGKEFEGSYFPGMTIEVTVPNAETHRFSHWRVNGSDVSDRSPVLRLTPAADVAVEAVYQ